MNDRNVLGLSPPRYLALMLTMVVVVILIPSVVLWVSLCPAMYIWLRFDESSPAATFVDRLFDLKRSR